ncbi:hypothetical protein CZ674_12790 [Agrococcus casei LMG 22410]|uniref:Uncharacterized protein n=1 Tax=Agrococcus casei LMG 22410 TaxID=1255656 RepID=A0A1R4GKY4_9MICO|nr:hypothetical protein CZ674_12790 [Agrococcus casei LMG 22410]
MDSIRHAAVSSRHRGRRLAPCAQTIGQSSYRSAADARQRPANWLHSAPERTKKAPVKGAFYSRAPTGRKLYPRSSP